MQGRQPGIGAQLRAAKAVVPSPQQRQGNYEEAEQAGDGSHVRQVVEGCEERDDSCTEPAQKRFMLANHKSTQAHRQDGGSVTNDDRKSCIVGATWDLGIPTNCREELRSIKSIVPVLYDMVLVAECCHP